MRLFFHLQNARALLVGQPPESCQQDYVAPFRRHIYQELVHEYETQKCGAHICTRSKGKQIQCENCHLWFHYPCADIKRKPKIFYCASCTAMINAAKC